MKAEGRQEEEEEGTAKDSSFIMLHQMSHIVVIDSNMCEGFSILVNLPTLSSFQWIYCCYFWIHSKMRKHENECRLIILIAL